MERGWYVIRDADGSCVFEREVEWDGLNMPSLHLDRGVELPTGQYWLSFELRDSKRRTVSARLEIQ